jgi:hypothetical protein
MQLLHALGDEAASPGGVNKDPLLQALCASVRLCRGIFFMYRECLGTLARSSGTGFRAGMRVRTDEHGLL